MSRNLANVFKDEIEKQVKAHVRRELKPLVEEVQQLRTEVREAKKRLGEVEKAPPGRTPPGARGQRFDANAIREMRHDYGYTQADLAAVIGVTPVAVYLWESGRTSPRGRTLRALSDLKSGGARKARSVLAEATGETRPAGTRRTTKRKRRARTKKTTAARRRKR